MTQAQNTPSLLCDLLQRLRLSNEGERLHLINLLTTVTDHSVDAITVKDRQGHYLLINQSASRHLGKPIEAVLGCDDHAIYPPEQAETIIADDRRLMAENRLRSLEQWQETPDGPRHFLILKGPLHDPEGRVIGLFAIARDMTALAADSIAPRTDEEGFRLALEHADGAILILSPEARFLYANREAARLLGQGAEALQTLGIPDILPPDEAESGMAIFAELREQGILHREIKLRQQDGTPVPALINAVALPDGNFYCALHDIHAHRQDEARWHHKATHDPLTGLPNRALFLDRLNHQLAYTRRHQSILALLLIDLEGFKEIKLGDEILGQIAVRLRNSVRKSDTLARLGGDEFAAILQDLEDAAGAAEVARKVLDLLSRPYRLEGVERHLSANIGIALYPNDGFEAQTLVKAAATAMALVKRRGETGFAFADSLAQATP